jgi:hypothetical protein
LTAVQTANSVESQERPERIAGSRRRRGLDIAVGLAVFAVGFGLYSARWIDLFPLDEFRSWLFLPRGSVDDLIRHVVFVRDQQYATYASRGVSMFVVKSSVSAFGLDTRWLNATQLLMIAASAALLYALVLRLVRRRAIAALAGALWLFSVPVVDSISWQATINDKLAALFTLVGLNVGLTFFRRRTTPLTIVVGNLALLAVVVLAYNSKESAWVLVPSLALLAVATLERFDWPHLRRAGALLVLPALYAAYHYLLYTRHTGRDDIWIGHVHNGDPWTNAKAYLRILANGESASGEPVLSRIATVLVVLLVTTIVVAAVVVIARRGWSRSSRDDADAAARVALWAGCSMMLAIAIPIRTQFHDSYYMLVPAIFLYILLGAGGAMLAPPRARRRAHLAAVATIVVVAAILALNFRASYDRAYAHIPQQSTNFTQAIRQIGHILPRHVEQPVVLVSADTTTNAYHFLGTGTWRDLYPYIFDTRTRNTEFERHFVDMKRSAYDGTPHQPGSYYVIFDDAMRLERIEHGTTILYP